MYRGIKRQMRDVSEANNNTHVEEFIGKVFNTAEDESKALEELDKQRQQIQATHSQNIIQHVRDVWPKINQNQSLQYWLIAYLYWNVLKLNVGTIETIFNFRGVMRLAQEVQLHGLVCYKCGNTLYINSRSDLFSKKSSNYNECDECWKAAGTRQSAEYIAQIETFKNRQRDLHIMPYREYLQTDEWQETRMRMLKKAGFRCQLCNKQGNLNVHHRTYERRGYEDPKDLIVLCADCHAKFHDKLPQE